MQLLLKDVQNRGFDGKYNFKRVYPDSLYLLAQHDYIQVK